VFSLAEGAGPVLVELSVMEQRYHAVLEVITSLVPVSEVAERYGVSRQTVHAWLRRYEAEGLPGLADRSHRPHRHPWQLDAQIAALICELRRSHRRWGPRRLRHELGLRGVGPVPSRSTVYRVLVREHLVQARSRRRSRASYRRWERAAPMDLWQMDITGSVWLADGTEAKLVTGVDDHSRFCVLAKVVRRATGRAVCQAFASALAEYGCPDQVLTDNGKQFTGKFNKPRPVEVLFDRICRKNGIEHLLTKFRSPTTTGKIERWHQTLQNECLDEHEPLTDIAEAQAVVDAFRLEYNTRRPHQSLDMATPASRFRPVPDAERAQLPLWLPPDLRPLDDSGVEVAASGGADPVCEGPWRGQGRSSVGRSTLTPPADPRSEPAAAPSVDGVEAVEVDRVVPVSGNLAVRPQQFWLGPARAGQTVTLWIDTSTVHLSVDGVRIKTLPSRFSTVDLARLRHGDARPAGPPPAPASPGRLAAGATIELDRIVNACGLVSLAGTWLQVGYPLAGQRVTLRLDEHLVHVVADGRLWRTMASPITAEARGRLRGARVAAPAPELPDGPVRVQRRVSSRGALQVCRQRVHVGLPHAGKTVTVEVDDTCFRILDQHETMLTVVPRTNTEEVTRFKAYGHKAARA
jgi:transposase InsO family protein